MKKMGEIERDVKYLGGKGYMPIEQKTITANEYAQELLGYDKDIPEVYKRVSIPFTKEAVLRINLIADNYETSFSKVAQMLCDIALPQLEAELEITEQDICDYYNKNKAPEEEGMTAIPKEYLDKELKAFFERGGSDE